MVPWGWGGPLRTRLRILVDRRAAKRAHLTLAVSEAARRHYLQGVRLPERTSRVLYNGIDLNRFRGCRELRSGFRAEFGIPAQAPVVGIVGRISKGKGHREFLEACASVKRTLPNAWFLVVGEGGGRPGAETLALELGLGGRAIFTGFRPDVPAALGAMDAFLFTSRPEEGSRVQEGFGGVVIEALAAGVPVVAFRLPMIDEVIEDGHTGRVVPLDDVEAMAGAALDYLERPEEAERASARGRAWAQRFSLERVAEETLRIYEDLLRQPRNGF
jgi:glycosyltransferase involved in cell wall biosynthesis